MNTWKAAYKDLTQLYTMSIIAVSNVGTIRRGDRSGRDCVGSSLAVSPGGKILLEGPSEQHAEQRLFTDYVEFRIILSWRLNGMSDQALSQIYPT